MPMIALHTLSTDFPGVSVIVQPPSSVLFAPYMHDIYNTLSSLICYTLQHIYKIWHIMKFRCNVLVTLKCGICICETPKVEGRGINSTYVHKCYWSLDLHPWEWYILTGKCAPLSWQLWQKWQSICSGVFYYWRNICLSNIMFTIRL